MNYTLIATSAFGIESVVKKEVKELGFNDITVENGKVTYTTDEKGIVASNLWLRCADRVFIKLAEFKAESFEELFQGVRAIAWADILSEDANFIINAKAVNSKLMSLSDIQSITMKAVVDKMKETYDVPWFSLSGGKHPILVSILKDTVTISLDTSGTALHKRGYREISSDAPLKETLACALIKLSDWSKDKPLIDPCCGSGTIPIEAAMMGLNIAPGLSRNFAFEDFYFLDKKYIKEGKKEAYSLIDYDSELSIEGYDIDHYIITTAKKNAEKAGVDLNIHFQCRPVKDLRSSKKGGVIICNPPYGERLGEEEYVKNLYSEMGQVFSPLETWSSYIITSYEKFEEVFGRKSNKNRKLYNGRLKCYLYGYFPKLSRPTKLQH